jgi:hypothetical protein
VTEYVVDRGSSYLTVKLLRDSTQMASQLKVPEHTYRLMHLLTNLYSNPFIKQTSKLLTVLVHVVFAISDQTAE